MVEVAEDGVRPRQRAAGEAPSPLLGEPSPVSVQEAEPLGAAAISAAGPVEGTLFPVEERTEDREAVAVDEAGEAFVVELQAPRKSSPQANP